MSHGQLWRPPPMGGDPGWLAPSPSTGLQLPVKLGQWLSPSLHHSLASSSAADHSVMPALRGFTGHQSSETSHLAFGGRPGGVTGGRSIRCGGRASAGVGSNSGYLQHWVGWLAVEWSREKRRRRLVCGCLSETVEEFPGQAKIGDILSARAIIHAIFVSFPQKKKMSNLLFQATVTVGFKKKLSGRMLALSTDL